MNKIAKYSLLIIFLILLFLVYNNYPKINMITGFAAKNVCSCAFEAGRDLESIETGDNDFGPVYYAENKIDYENRSVASTVFGLKQRKAVYQDGVGCILLPEDIERANFEIPKPNRIFSTSQAPYPYGCLLY